MNHHIELRCRGKGKAKKYYSAIVRDRSRANRVRYRSDDHKTRAAALAEAKALRVDTLGARGGAIKIVDMSGV